MFSSQFLPSPLHSLKLIKKNNNKKQLFSENGTPTQLLVTEFFFCRKTGVGTLEGEFRALLPHLSYA